MRQRDIEQLFTRRALGAGAIGTVVWGGLAARLIQLQVVDQEIYKADAAENGINRDPYPPQRGLIYDRFGVELATHRKAGRVSYARENVADPIETLNRLGELIDISDARRARILRELRTEHSFVPIVVADELTYEEFARLNVFRPDLPGVNIEFAETRSYPRGREFAHVLGYVARANANDLKRLTELPASDTEQQERLIRIFKHPDMRVGRLGLESYADEWLRGKPGFRHVVKNAAGRVIEELPNTEDAPVPGNDVWVTIDADLQRAAIERFGDESGAAVVMDILSGDVLALVSTPAYDPNAFVNGISTTDYNKLRSNDRSPLYHKAYDGVYPPGSTFKMVVAAAALKAGVVDPNERVTCRGKIQFGNRHFHCWKRGGHGPVNMHEGIKTSCDVYFYELARRTGAEAIADMAREFGLGQRYELGMTGGVAGIVPNDAWKRGYKGEPWYDGDTLNFGIGQGYLNTTPLQLAVMTSRLAHPEGLKVVPRLVGVGPRVETPITDGRIDQEIAERMRAAMYGVTSEARGTALRSGDVGLEDARMAGKTGTAQVRRISMAERATGVIKNDKLPRKQRDHALFVGYAPHDNPRYAISVVVEHGGSGSGMAGPIARDIMKMALQRRSGDQPDYASLKTKAG